MRKEEDFVNNSGKNMGNGKILIIEDNPSMLVLYSQLGSELGLPIEAIRDGSAGLKRGLDEQFALVILDLSLPQIGGIEICRRLRQNRPGLPIIMVTSRMEDADKVLGFEVGADDYVTKPFSMPELTARVRAILRRQREYQSTLGSPPVPDDGILVFGELSIDLSRRQVRRGEKELEFSALEFDVIAYLAIRAGHTVTRDTLLTEIWGYAPNTVENFDSTLSTTLSRIRTKLEPAPEKPRYILTMRGVGYRFTERSSSTP